MKKKIIGFILAVVILGVLAWYVSVNWQDFNSLQFAAPWLLLPTALGIALNIYATGMLMDVTLQPLGVFLRRKEVFGLASLTRFSNVIASGYIGMMVRAVYLKKTYNFSFAKFSSTFVVSNAILFLVSGLLALTTFVLHGSTGTQDSTNVVIVVLIVMSVLTAMFTLPLHWLQRWLQRRSGKVFNRLATFTNSFLIIRSRPLVLVKIIAWAATALLSFTLVTFFLYQTLGHAITPLQVVFITALSSWGIVFSITPGNIGVREGLMALAAQLIGVPVATTIAVALLMRLLVFLVAALASAYFAPRLLGVSLLKISRFKSGS